MIDVKIYHKESISIELIKETFEASFNIPFDEKYWEWRFLNNPNNDKVFISYILEDGILAAYYAVSPMELIFNNNEYKVALSNMTMTHPKYRGRGYFKLLAKALYDDLKENDFFGVYGFANHNSHYGFRKYLNWQDLSPLNIFKLEKNQFRNMIDSGNIYTFSEEIITIETLKTIEQLSLKKNKISVSRSFRNLKWRVIDNPSNQYSSLKIFSNNNLVYIIIFKDFNGEVDIMEMFQMNNEKHIEILSVSMNYFLESKSIINCWSNIHSDEHLLLEKLGFKESIFNTYFGLIPFSENTDLLDYKKWHYSFLDSDIF